MHTYPAPSYTMGLFTHLPFFPPRQGQQVLTASVIPQKGLAVLRCKDDGSWVNLRSKIPWRDRAKELVAIAKFLP